MDNLQLIEQKFPGRVLLQLGEVCQILGIAKATALNHISAGRFILPVLKEHNRCFVHVMEIANYLDGLSTVASKTRKLGRPTKAEQKAREAMKQAGVGQRSER
ncbi:MAG: hypothetical protein ACYCTY_07630 [Sulfuricella sp.]